MIEANMLKIKAPTSDKDPFFHTQHLLQLDHMAEYSFCYFRFIFPSQFRDPAFYCYHLKD